MHHPIPKPLKGNYPHAVLHEVRTNGVPSAIELTRKLSEDEMTHDEAVLYVSACLKTKGQPQILDLLEDADPRPGPSAYLRGPHDEEYKGGII